MSSFEGIVEAASDVATDDERDPEGHTIAWERQQIAALLDETRLTLASIEAAEQRLADGLYGTCTTCGLEIAVDGLDAGASWAADTSDDATEWSPNNPARGQCAVTARVVQDYLGGRC